MKLSILSFGAVIPSTEENWQDELEVAIKRRTPKIWQMSHLAAARAIEQSDKKPTAVICGTTHGALNESAKFIDKLSKNDLGSPRQFLFSVHNNIAGKIALDFNIEGANITLCDSHTSLASAVITSTLLKDEVILLVAAEEHLDVLDEIYKDLSSEKLSTAPKEGAVALVLTKEDVPDVLKISATPPKPTVCKDKAEYSSFFKPVFTMLNAIKAKEECLIKSFSLSAEASATVTIEQ